MEPGAQAPIDVLPVLKYVPERWAKWKTLCRDVRIAMFNLYEHLVVQCERRVAQNVQNGSLLESILEDKKLSSDRALIRCVSCLASSYHGSLSSTFSTRGTLGAFMEGASETTAMFLRSFILRLVASPETQIKAQKEIDAVVGIERAPVPSDFEQLPYVQAIVKEVS